MKSRFGIVAILLALVAVVALGQTTPVPVSPKSKEAFKELFKEVRTWAQSNVIPKMTEWKSKLDDAMSQTDLQTLNVLRERAAKLKADGKTLAADVRAARRTKAVAKLRLYKEKARLLKKERAELLKDLKPLALTYKSTLIEIGKDAKPYKKEWRDGFKKIVKEWYEDRKGDLGKGGRRVFARSIQRMRRLHGLDEDLKAKIGAARFMLWDGKDLPEVADFSDEPDAKSDDPSAAAPDGYSLDPNYPNPFNPSTKISFTIARPEFVTLSVYDALGREVAKLVDSNLSAGSHSATFDGRRLASGLYVYRIHAGTFVQEKKMQLVK